MRRYLVIPVILSGLLLSFGQLYAADVPTKIKPVFVLSGSDSGISKPTSELCRTEKELQDVWKKHEGFNSKIHCPQVDFGSYMVIALFNGANETDTAPSIYEVLDDSESIHLRIIVGIHFWLINGPPRTSPEQIEADRLERIRRCYAFIVLPASKKTIVIEEVGRFNSDVPHKWQESKRFPAIEKK